MAETVHTLRIDAETLRELLKELNGRLTDMSNDIAALTEKVEQIQKDRWRHA